MTTHQLVTSLLFLILSSNHPPIHGFYLHDQSSNEDIGENEIGDEKSPAIDNTDHLYKSRQEDPMQDLYSNPPYVTLLHSKKAKPINNLSLPLFDDPEKSFSDQDGDHIHRGDTPVHRVIVPSVSFRVRRSANGCHIVSAIKRKGSTMAPGIIVVESRSAPSPEDDSTDQEHSSRRYRKSEGLGEAPGQNGGRTIRYRGPDNLLYQLNIPYHDDYQYGPVSENEEKRRYETNNNL